jgi:hypothetical protein
MSDTIPRTRSVDRSPVIGTEDVETPEEVARRRGRGALGALGFALVTAGFLTYGVRAGMPAGDMIRALLVVAATQVVPGALCWRCVRPRDGWWFEDLAMGFTTGAILAVGAQVLAGLTRMAWLSAGVGVGVAAALAVIPRTRTRILTAKTSPMPVWWGPIVALSSLATLPQLHALFRFTPLAWASGARTPYIDAYFHLGLASELATRGPTRFPWVESEPLAYHWFSHAWVAQVSDVSGAPLDETLFRFLPVVMPLIIALVAATAAVRLSGRLWAGPVAAILTIATVGANVFGKYTNSYRFDLLFHPRSPSLAFATPPLIGVVVVLALRWRRELTRGGLVFLILFCIGAAGSKGSTLPLIVAGLMVTVAAMWWVDRSRLREVVMDLVIVVGCLLFTIATVFRANAGESIRLDPSRAAAQTQEANWLGGVSSLAVHALIVAIATTTLLTRGAGLVGLFTTRESRRDPLAWLLLGASVAGAAVVVLATGPGINQVHFARSAGPLMALGSALGVVVLIERLGPRARIAVPLGLLGGPVIALAPVALLGTLDSGEARQTVAMIGIAGAVLATLAAIAAIAGAREWPIVTAATLVVALLAAGTTVVINSIIHYEAPAQDVVDVTAAGAVSRDQIDAARWIRDHSDADDVVITNRHCSEPVAPERCDARRFVVAAYTERQVLVEGWSYTPAHSKLKTKVGGRVDYWRPELLALNDGFIVEPTAEAARELSDLGVRWIFIDNTIAHAETLEPFADLRFSNPGVDVYQL